ncbi:hypothetical protein ACFYUR_19110 [Micromonospora haikouensis]|uniref:hypothetical protein n=1 Tax=Micromonospora haikouensis TaxID=686309 RepID=UPI0036B4FFEB
MNPRSRRNMARTVGQAADVNAVPPVLLDRAGYPASTPVNSPYQPQRPTTRSGVR